jgi:hypothetical protein
MRVNALSQVRAAAWTEMRSTVQVVGDEIDLAIGLPAPSAAGNRVIEAVADEREALVAGQRAGRSAFILWREGLQALGARHLVFHQRFSGNSGGRWLEPTTEHERARGSGAGPGRLQSLPEGAAVRLDRGFGLADQHIRAVAQLSALLHQPLGHLA